MALGPGVLVQPDHRAHDTCREQHRHIANAQITCRLPSAVQPAAQLPVIDLRLLPGSAGFGRSTAPASGAPPPAGWPPHTGGSWPPTPPAPLITQPLMNRGHRHPASSWPVMNSWCSARRPGHLPQPVSASSGTIRGQLRPPLLADRRPTRAHPATIAAAVYLRIVLRSTPRLAAIWFCDRPACQWIKISEMSITSKDLLAIGPPSLKTGRTLLASRWPGPPRTHAMLMGNYVIGVGNYVIAIR